MTDLTTSIKHFTDLNRAPGPTWTETTKRKALHKPAPAAGGAGLCSPRHYYRAIHRRHRRFKPLLLLAVLDLVQRGVITTPLIAVTADLLALETDGPLAPKTWSKKIL